MRKIKIEDKKYYGLDCKGKIFANFNFTKCTFTECTFTECTFVDCNFENCDLEKISTSKFISCSFSSCSILGLGGSYFVDCQFNDLSFGGNTEVKGNTFDRVRGNIKNGGYCSCLGVFDNTFKDMDFSGFVDFYFLGPSAVDLVENRFINTTISTESIMRLANKTKYFGSTFRGRGNISPETGLYICLNMEKLSDKEKFGLIANAFSRLPKVEEDVLFYDPETTTELKSRFHLSFVDNDNSPDIVNNDGRVLKPDAIPRPDIQIDFCEVVSNIAVIRDAEIGIYGVDTDDDSIYESLKHSIKR